MEHMICNLEEARISGTCGGNLEEAAGLVEHVISNLEEAAGLVEHVIGNLEEAGEEEEKDF